MLTPLLVGSYYYEFCNSACHGFDLLSAFCVECNSYDGSGRGSHTLKNNDKYQMTMCQEDAWHASAR